MRTSRIIGLALSFVISVASLAPAAGDEAPFIRKPRVMGSMISTVTTYRLRDGDSFGSTINCSGRCFGSGQTFHWQCKAEGDEIMHCALDCNHVPHGQCRPE